MVILQGDGGWNFCRASGGVVAGACSGSLYRQGYVGNNGGQPAESEISDGDATRGPSTISYILSPPSPPSPLPPPPSLLPPPPSPPSPPSPPPPPP
eukprot:scaffold118581_cov80-Phaeocystis_antarctica.AAC.1